MFLAVDGVAPRAKMNQQRSRRFRSSKEREVLLAEYVAKEGKLPDAESFDSNCITPGTDFMYKLGIAFRRWIKFKMDTDPFWQTGAEIVFSGPDVPGEGEHKIMDMIREDRAALGDAWKPGMQRYCMYGLDADLIMLSLATHEPYFVLLREKISRRKQNKDAMSYSQEDFELLEISILRKMLKQHFSSIGVKSKKVGAEGGAGNSYEKYMRQVTDASLEADHADDATETAGGWSIKKFDLERIIDDFVFMCFFIGNDFLPCLPHLDIADGSLSLMMNIYKDIIPSLNGYLTDKNRMQLYRVELFIQEVARREPLYFQQRAIDEKDVNVCQLIVTCPMHAFTYDCLQYAGDGYKEHYYKTKFGIEPGDKKAVTDLCRSYLEGLYWVLTYYHKGCESWTWYYPYLYAPLASDLVNLAEYDITFEKGAPFTPLLQLLSVLPPQSGPFLPRSYMDIMVNPASPLVECYPKDFEVDANGKKNSWECIVRIPFINQDDLVNAASAIDHKTLEESERRRNIMGEEFRMKAPRAPAPSERKTADVDMADRGSWGNALTDDRRRPSNSGWAPKTSYGTDTRRNDAGRGGRGPPTTPAWRK